MNSKEFMIARIKRDMTKKDISKILGISYNAWCVRERGNAAVTLEEAATLGRELGMSKEEWVAIFFDGKLPFRNEST